jgi:hypothetical protein
MGPFATWRTASAAGRRAAPRIATLVAASAVAVLVGACAGAPPGATVVAGQRTRVALTDVTSGRSFVLQNASSGSAHEVYSERSGDQAVKVVADPDLQQLLDVLADRGMFETAAEQPARDARDLLIVEAAGRRWVWSRRLRGIDATELQFHEARSYFLTFYNQVMAYHAGDIDKQGLQDENARAQQGGEAAKSRLEQYQRRDR